MDRVIYLDYNSTTPVDSGVLDAMLPYLREQFGNPSSSHVFGLGAESAISFARQQVARLVGAAPSEIVFTGGGSESENLAIKGVVFSQLARSPHVVTTVAEHPATLNTLAYLKQRFGIQTTLLKVDEYGLVSPEAVEAALRPETVLVSIMHANNEVGTIQPIAEIGAITRNSAVLLHVDAAQSAGKIPIDVHAMKVDLLTVAGHKLYTPKGIGALFVRDGTTLDSLIHGSGQERGMRAGTENVAGAVALGAAAKLALKNLSAEPERLMALRDECEALLRDAIPELRLNGHPTHRLPNTLNVSFPGVSGRALLAYAPGIAASTGSACHSGFDAPSPVLISMGLAPERADGAVRLSLGHETTRDDIHIAVDSLIEAFRALSGM